MALGSNQHHPRIGSPRAVVKAAAMLVGDGAGEVRSLSPIVETAPVGPSLRRYANAALLVDSLLSPLAMLDKLQAIEASLGRVRRGQPWRARVIDLDLVLWSGGVYAHPRLLLPHPLFAERAFVLGPAIRIAPEWHDPLSHLTLAQLHARLTRPKPLPR
ncbi:MAG: 2-amino-4-hydroxy-6-hydroxymethyldihydropteridine diphosphokinase [Alteraurantiacibacter sp.]|nr:2-amino-4-hydroxy-6-hydroxymethyldihydropteridine diphosphokinase [Alteraurantiacibacter sp.]